MGSGARVRRSLAVASPVSFMFPLGARLEATHDGEGLQPEKRHDLAAEVMRIIRRRKTRYGGVLENIPVPNIFCGAVTRSLLPTNPSPCRYPDIDRLPQAMCLGLS
jgi:hypothetical protein